MYLVLYGPCTMVYAGTVLKVQLLYKYFPQTSHCMQNLYGLKATSIIST